MAPSSEEAINITPYVQGTLSRREHTASRQAGRKEDSRTVATECWPALSVSPEDSTDVACVSVCCFVRDKTKS